MAGDLTEITAPMQGTVIQIAPEGTIVGRGRPIAILESMKMQHDIISDIDGCVESVSVVLGEAVKAGQLLCTLSAVQAPVQADEEITSVSFVRRDLEEVHDRHQLGLDESRRAQSERRHGQGRQTARENLALLVDPGSFVEYGPVVIAAQRRRRSIDDLIAHTPADGLVGGLASINGDLFPGQESRAVVMSYDYAVLAGTQGSQNHRKKDRLFDVAERLQLPIVFFAEGGGGRPGDTDAPGVSGLDCWAFHDFARLSGLVPLVGITGGYCFAGNAALLGCCDVVIACEGSNIAMGGPAMIEGGGLGIFDPKEIGPLEIQRANGVVDIVVGDDAEAVEVARKYLSYFQGALRGWTEPDQTLLREVIPVHRVKAYDVRAVINLMFDVDSVLEIRQEFGLGMITSFARVQGQSVGVIANNPNFLAGAIDSDGADKAARFMQLCDAFDIPIVTLVDTPGMMVGPDVERTALVRHCSRLFVTGANLAVPVISIVLRKSYGLGAQAMMAGSTKSPLACVAWPTGEFGGMGLEGAVRLGYRKELDAIADPEERESTFRKMVDRMYESGKALSVATHFEIDDVIDPADSRKWISAVLSSVKTATRIGKKRANIDTW